MKIYSICSLICLLVGSLGLPDHTFGIHPPAPANQPAYNPGTQQGSSSTQEPGGLQGSDSKQGSGTKLEGSDSKQGSASKTDGSSTTVEIDEDFQQFLKMGEELKRNERMITQLAVSMPVGFPERTLQQKAKIKSLKGRNLQIYQQLLPTAKKSFENFPNSHEPINKYLVQHLSYQLTGKNWQRIPFNPVDALRNYKMLEASGIERPELSLLGYRIHFLLNDFEQSRKLLIQAAERGRREQPAMDNLKMTYKAWLRELEFRRMDAENNNPHVKIETDAGDMLVELFEDQAPNTVANFISLVESGFYNDLAFYQSNPTEVVVTGSPTNDGLGGPGYKIKCECDREDYRQHFTGYLATYPTRKDEGGSRFLITKQPRPGFDGNSTAFGRVIEGLENLYKIRIVDLARRTSNPNIVPTRITRMSVVRKRDHEYVPEKTIATPGIPGSQP